MSPAESEASKKKDDAEKENPGKGYRTAAEIDKSNQQDVERTRKEAAGEA